MTSDLRNLRAVAFYLSKTELKFDLVSAVDELNRQIQLEFDFTREARVMDTISLHLRDVNRRIQVPRSIPGLVTRQLLVMSFLSGAPLTDAQKFIKRVPPAQRAAAKRRILHRVSEAYGRMILGEGLFQADGHPGNILIGKGGRIGLLDYGQSKQLTVNERLAFAQLVVALSRGHRHDKSGNDEEISRCLDDLGIVIGGGADAATRTELAFGMFDTRGRVDPFDPDSPLQRAAIETFPPNLFFVLRVVQLLRGLSSGMGVDSFSTARLWAPYAKASLREAEGGGGNGPLAAAWYFLSKPPRMLGSGLQSLSAFTGPWNPFTRPL